MEHQFAQTSKYRIISDTIIETASSVVYKAMDLNLQRAVCIKKVSIEGQTSVEIDKNKEKAFNEVRAMINISEFTNQIPTIYNVHYDQNANELYIIMQWINGYNLRKYMTGSISEFLNWMIDLVDILSIMEAKNIYHKDIKPENIMIDKNRKLYLIDFNLSLSLANRLEGTVNYRAPEMDARSIYTGREKVDMFAIGVIMYEFFTGSVPQKSVDYGRSKSRGSYEWDLYISPKEKNILVPDSINTIIYKCMKLDVKQRYKSNSDLKMALKEATREIKYGKK